MNSRSVFVLALFIWTGVSGAAQAEDLIVYFHDRPPYSWRDSTGNMKGVVAEPAERALQSAGIAFKWELLPSARQMEVIKGNELGACGLGWFKRPEREAFARFSAPIYHDKRMIIIARSNDGRFLDQPQILTLFARKDLTLLTKVGYSYGSYVDAQLKSLAPMREETSTDNFHMLDMIALGRADYMLMSSEEAEYLLREHSPAVESLRDYPLLDAPEGEARYLMCTPRVPQSLIDRFNAALSVE